MAAIVNSPAPVPPADDGYPPPPTYNDTVQEFAPGQIPPLSDAELAAQEAQQAENRRILASQATEVEPGSGTGYSVPPTGQTDTSLNPNTGYEAGVETQVGRLNAQDQETLSSRTGQGASADWRVKISLASSASYLNSGILQPVTQTGGVIFPYTPTIETTYKAKYDSVDLVHSNYRGYFYKNSSPEEVSIRGTFTAQDSSEAAYLLAVIHFFRSVTKMFYGQDAEAGTPPPLVYLSAYGQYQFNKNPCVVTSFSYMLPQDVDYIRADGFNNYGINLENRRPKRSGPGPGGGLLDFVKSKLQINGLTLGGLPQTQMPSAVNMNVSNTGSGATNSTYVPTKMEISISLLPIQTRNQVSQQFSLRDFASGELLKKGFW